MLPVRNRVSPTGPVWWPDDEFGDEPPAPALGPLEALGVEVEDNPVTGVLLDQRGAVLLELCERAMVPFGFQAPASPRPVVVARTMARLAAPGPRRP